MPQRAGSGRETRLAGAALEFVICPVSSGSRKASSAARGNSVSSSGNSPPPWGSEMSPGRGSVPPPASATALAVWCGARIGRKRLPVVSAPTSVRPRRAVLASASSSSASVGSSPGSRCASIDLPLPGGPTIRKTRGPYAGGHVDRKVSSDEPARSHESPNSQRTAPDLNRKPGSRPKCLQCSIVAVQGRVRRLHPARSGPSFSGQAAVRISPEDIGARPCG